VAPMAGVSRDLIHKHLYTLGELLRSGELRPDKKKAARTSKQLSLFGKRSKQ
jgi:hypothetical protein